MVLLAMCLILLQRSVSPIRMIYCKFCWQLPVVGTCMPRPWREGDRIETNSRRRHVEARSQEWLNHKTCCVRKYHPMHCCGQHYGTMSQDSVPFVQSHATRSNSKIPENLLELSLIYLAQRSMLNITDPPSNMGLCICHGPLLYQLFVIW
jgi:hypothetical protein